MTQLAIVESIKSRPAKLPFWPQIAVTIATINDLKAIEKEFLKVVRSVNG
jgi:hypothetical protein